MLQVGCGVGNSAFPLLELNQSSRVYACDFAPAAVELVKAHQQYSTGRMHAFVADITCDDLRAAVPANTVDICTMVFVLSAITPAKMPAVRSHASCSPAPYFTSNLASCVSEQCQLGKMLLQQTCWISVLGTLAQLLLPKAMTMFASWQLNQAVLRWTSLTLQPKQHLQHGHSAAVVINKPLLCTAQATMQNHASTH